MTGQQWGGNLLPVLRTVGEEKFKIISEHVQIVPNLHVSILETKNETSILSRKQPLFNHAA